MLCVCVIFTSEPPENQLQTLFSKSTPQYVRVNKVRIFNIDIFLLLTLILYSNFIDCPNNVFYNFYNIFQPSIMEDIEFLCLLSPL